MPRWPKRPRQWDKIIKIGRTHLADATPLRLGQEFGGFARQLQLSHRSGQARLCKPVLELPAGGTAVGSGINTHPEFGRRVAARWRRKRKFRLSRRSTISKPTPSAMASWKPAASCAPSPSHYSTSPTTFAGWPAARAADITKYNFPIYSRAARSCREK